jgi:hypothetical protein
MFTEILILLFFEGLVGWGLFAIIFIHTIKNRQRELDIIETISHELKKIKEEIKQLK